MNNRRIVIFSLLTISLLVFTASAQETSDLPYMDSKLSPEERAADLVHRRSRRKPHS